jgi:hypothetical protein
MKKKVSDTVLVRPSIEHNLEVTFEFAQEDYLCFWEEKGVKSDF